MLTALFKHDSLSPIWRLSHWAYSAPSSLWVRNGSGRMTTLPGLESAEGSRQGDPLGSLLFDLGVHPAYKECAAKVPTAVVKALHDDLFLIGSPADVEKAYNTFKTAAEKMGLVVQPKKSRLLWFHTLTADLERTNEIRRLATRLDFTYIDKATTILGSAVGCDEQAVKELTMAAVLQHKPFFDGLLDPKVPSQVALQLLRKSGVPRLSYLLRTTRPSLMAEAAAVFRDKLLSTAKQKLGLSIHHNSTALDSQLCLPLSLGGFGLTDPTATSHLAWFAAIAESVQEDSDFWQREGSDKVATEMDSVLEKMRKLAESDVDKEEKDPAFIFPQNWSWIFQYVDSLNDPKSDAPQSLQHRLQQRQHDRQYGALVDSFALLPYHQARLRAIRGPAPWLAIAPSDFSLRLSDSETHLASQFRLGIASPLLPVSCPCGASFDADPFHSLSCMKFNTPEITHRHELVVGALQKSCWRLGLPVMREPRQLTECNKSRPADLLVTVKSKQHLIDCTVRTSTNPSHLPICLKDGSAGVLRAAENSKLATYHKHKLQTEQSQSDQQLQEQTKFLPFACDSYGNLGRGAAGFLSTLVSEAKSCPLYTTQEFQQLVTGSVAVAIQRGNTVAYLKTLNNAGAARPSTRSTVTPSRPRPRPRPCLSSSSSSQHGGTHVPVAIPAAVPPAALNNTPAAATHPDQVLSSVSSYSSVHTPITPPSLDRQALFGSLGFSRFPTLFAPVGAADQPQEQRAARLQPVNLFPVPHSSSPRSRARLLLRQVEEESNSVSV